MAREESSADDAVEPAWLCLLGGCMWAAAHVAAPSDVGREARALDAATAARAPRAPDAVDGSPLAADVLRRMSPRELRQLPGVGQTRALAIARDRWGALDGDRLEALERVPGIGPETSRQVRAWLEEHAGGH